MGLLHSLIAIEKVALNQNSIQKALNLSHTSEGPRLSVAAEV